jgi:hypothetical protein
VVLIGTGGVIAWLVRSRRGRSLELAILGWIFYVASLGFGVVMVLAFNFGDIALAAAALALCVVCGAAAAGTLRVNMTYARSSDSR